MGRAAGSQVKSPKTTRFLSSKKELNQKEGTFPQYCLAYGVGRLREQCNSWELHNECIWRSLEEFEEEVSNEFKI